MMRGNLMQDHETQEHHIAEVVDEDTLTLEELSEIQAEIQEQPHWRHIADILQEVKSLNL